MAKAYISKDSRGLVEKENGIEMNKCNQISYELNMQSEKLELHEQPALENLPIDKYRFVYIIFIIHGIGILMPWNMFMTAKSYYTDYKLNVTLSNLDDDNLLKSFKFRFLSIAGVSSQIPNLLFNGVNLLLAYFASTGGLSLGTRIVSSIFFNSIIMLFTLVLVLVDSNEWALSFFYINVITIILLNMSNGVYQNSIYGAAAQLPPKFTNAVILGNNICGTLVSLISIASIAMSPGARQAAFYYFLSALMMLIICVCSYFLLPMSPFYRHYSSKSANTGNLNDKQPQSSRPAYGYVLSRTALQCSNVYFTFLVSLILFPAIVSDVQPISDGSIPISPVYFTPVVCYLAFNVTAMIGNMMSAIVGNLPASRLHYAVIARFAFIPFFLFCNYKPDIYPTFFSYDWIYALGVLALGLSHGYLSSLGMMYAPQGVFADQAPIAGMLSAFFLVFGIFTGICLSFLF